MIKKIRPKELFKGVDMRRMPFQTTLDLEPLDGVIAQERALDAIQTGLVLKKRNFNIFACGLSGTGRTSTVQSLVEKQAAQEPVPDDWVIVTNFRYPERPLTLSFPVGKGRKFKKSMAEFVKTLKQELPKAFQSSDYRERIQALLSESMDKQGGIFKKLSEEAEKLGFQLKGTRSGIVTLPVLDGKALNNKEFEKIPNEQKKAFEKKRKELEPMVRAFIADTREVDMQTRDKVREAQQNIARTVIDRNIEFLRKEFGDDKAVASFMDMLMGYMLENAGMFINEDQEDESTEVADWTQYEVNLLVDNSEQKGAPVVFEDNPTYYNLVGKIEKRAENGVYLSDFTMIKSGSLLRANGGYLLINAEDILTHSLAWPALKKMLKTRKLMIEELGEQYSFLPTSGLKPDAINLNCKVIMIGSSHIFSLLYEWDEDFRKLFQIKAEFDYEIPRNQETIMEYARFMATTCKREALRPVDKTGVAAVIGFGSRMVESKTDMSVRFDELSNLLVEADMLAGREKKDIISHRHVKEAVQRREKRSSLWSEKMYRNIAKDIMMIDTRGGKKGQVNGLAVYDTGDMMFGKPIRITVETFRGKGGILNVERESKLAGNLFNKSVYVINGLLGRWFGMNHELSMNISLVVEQSYGGIDGDSASLAEISAIISSLADAPIEQGIAITGSVNQKGDVQPIGGVNEKIEGFFEVCRQAGLTGSQGVIIPRRNVDNLMLKQRVVDAVRRGHFHVWTIDSVDDALELLMGMPVGEPDKDGHFPEDSLFGRVEAKLAILEEKDDDEYESDQGASEKDNPQA